MDLEILHTYCLSKPGVEECFPFDEHTLVFKVMGKMYALVPLERVPLQINLKCDPEKAIELREEYPDLILPGYHMSKVHWNTVIFEYGLNDSFIIDLINHSYDLVVSKLPKKLKEELSDIESNS